MSLAEEDMRVTGSNLPGPLIWEGCSADYSGQGLIAIACSSSISVIDTASLQLVHSLMHPQGLQAPLCSVRFQPSAFTRDLSHSSHLRIAAGDKQGHIAIWDVVGQELIEVLAAEKGNGAVRGLEWIPGTAGLLAALHGEMLVIVWDTAGRQPVWRYESAGKPCACLASSPCIQRQVYALGSRGQLITLLARGPADGDVSAKMTQVPLPEEKDRAASTVSTGSVLSCVFPSDSSGILYILLGREILAFEEEYAEIVGTTPLPRILARALTAVAPTGSPLLFCLHVDGKLSAWHRRRNTQLLGLVQVEALMPTLATSAPSPQVLALLQCGPVLHEDGIDTTNHGGAGERTTALTLASISDDGKVWQWQVQAKEVNPEEGSIELALDTTDAVEAQKHQEKELSMKVELIGMLHGLPSAVTTLALATPLPGVEPLPLVALATQGGSLELLDVSTHAICTSYSVHSTMVRGVRWLGNSRLVTFSFIEVKGKGGGFQNRLMITCARSGQSRPFRVLQQPERAPLRGLRSSPSGRYLLLLFREAPAEVWAMTRTPQMLRALPLPFTVLEWALPPLQSSGTNIERSSITATASAVAAAAQSVHNSISDKDVASASKGAEEASESFAFALVNGSLGVFELRGRRVRDFRPKWPKASFVAPDLLVTAMAYRSPLVVLGDRLGTVRCWNTSTGAAKLFPTHRGAIRRLKLAPVLPTLGSAGRAAVLFSDRTFILLDLDNGDVVPFLPGQEQLVRLQILDLDWVPLRKSAATSPDLPQILCAAAADGSVRLLEIYAARSTKGAAIPDGFRVVSKLRFRPAPLCSVALLPPAHALALRLLLQHGVEPDWLRSSEAHTGGTPPAIPDLRMHLLSKCTPARSDNGALEVLLKSLEQHRTAGGLMAMEAVEQYRRKCQQGCAARCAEVAVLFGDVAEAAFWRHLPIILAPLMKAESAKQAAAVSLKGAEISIVQEDALESSASPFVSSQSSRIFNSQQSQSDSFSVAEEEEEWSKQRAKERIAWHKSLTGSDAAQRRVHELIVAGDYDSAVTMLLASPMDSPTFQTDALRAMALASAVSPAMHELAIKVVAANMAQSTDGQLAATHLLCAVGRYQEACSQLQDAGRWRDAQTLASTHLDRHGRSRVLERWAHHCLLFEHDLWRAMELFVRAGALVQAMAALRDARQPDTAQMFLMACEEASSECRSETDNADDQPDDPKTQLKKDVAPARSEEVVEEKLPGNLGNRSDEVAAVHDSFKKYQRWLAHLCTSHDVGE